MNNTTSLWQLDPALNRETLFTQEYPDLYLVCKHRAMQRGISEADAEDIAQTVLLAVWQKFDLGLGLPIFALSNAILRAQISEFWRKYYRTGEKCQIKIAEDDDLEDLALIAPPDSESFEEAYSLVKKLDSHSFNLLNEKIEGRMTVEQMAAGAKVSRECMKSRLRRARRKLRKTVSRAGLKIPCATTPRRTRDKSGKSQEGLARSGGESASLAE